jgi:Flp pilus assembly protein TadG
MKLRDRIGIGGKKGITIIWLALFMLPLLIIFAGMALDIAYMYNVKNQLQVAADAAALAGAEGLEIVTESGDMVIDTGTNFQQLPVRQEAWKFACKNKAGDASQDGSNPNRSVFLATNSSLDCNTPPTSNLNEEANADTADIVVGNWLGTRTPPFIAANGSTGLPINAVKVVARRTGETPGMPPVRVFWGKIFDAFPAIGSNWSFMNAVGTAVAAKPPRASSFVDVGTSFGCPAGCTYPDTCEIGDTSYATICVSPGNPYPCCTGLGTGNCLARVLQAEPTSIKNLDNAHKFGWTSLLLPPGSCNQFKHLMCTNAPAQDTCYREIEGITGSCTDALRDYESLMYDPNYDSTNKETNSSGRVIGWWVIFPQTNEEDPMSPPGPHETIGYVLVHVIAVCASGGPGCRGYDICDAWPNPSPPPPSVNNVIVIDRISCIGCGTGAPAPGLKAVLVK